MSRLGWLVCQIRGHDTRTVAGVTTCRHGCGLRVVRDDGRFALSPRQRQVAVRVVNAMTDKEIAADLGISVNVVRHHMSQVYLKCGVSGSGPTARLELARAMGHLIPPDLDEVSA